MSRVLVCGGRLFKDWELLALTLEPLGVTRVITGGCSGADNMAVRWADEHSLPVSTFLANWEAARAAAWEAMNTELERLLTELLEASK